jgi:hypothetical protein
MVAKVVSDFHKPHDVVEQPKRPMMVTLPRVLTKVAFFIRVVARLCALMDWDHKKNALRNH